MTTNLDMHIQPKPPGKTLDDKVIGELATLAEKRIWDNVMFNAECRTSVDMRSLHGEYIQMRVTTLIELLSRIGAEVRDFQQQLNEVIKR